MNKELIKNIVVRELEETQGNSQRYFLARFKEVSGKMENESFARIEASSVKEAEENMTYIAKAMYDEEASEPSIYSGLDKEGKEADCLDGYYHLGGEVLVRFKSLQEVRKNDFDVLKNLRIG